MARIHQIAMLTARIERLTRREASAHALLALLLNAERIFDAIDRQRPPREARQLYAPLRKHIEKFLGGAVNAIVALEAERRREAGGGVR